MKDTSNKCIKIHAAVFGTVAKGDPLMVVRRVTSDEAFEAVHHGPWIYANRAEWKAAGRKWGLGL